MATFSYWVFFFVVRKCVLPEGLAKLIHEMIQIPKCYDLIAYTMVSSISTCKHSSCIYTLPRLVLKVPGATKQGLGTRK